MEIIKIEVAPFGSNCYILSGSGEAVIVDAGGGDAQAAEIIRRQNLSLKYVLFTHGHFDHTAGGAQLKELFSPVLCIHEDDYFMTLSGNDSKASMFSYPFKPFECDKRLKDGDELWFDGGGIKVLHTPGHTRGGLCFFIDGNLFTGDTLFRNSVGRTDLPSGDMKALTVSLERLKSMPDDTVVLPGHGATTTIGAERMSNPFV